MAAARSAGRDVNNIPAACISLASPSASAMANAVTWAAPQCLVVAVTVRDPQLCTSQ